MCRKYTVGEMKRLNSEKGNHYFSKDSMKAWASRIEGTYNNGFFIDSIDNFNRTSRIYKVCMFMTDYDVCTIEYFDCKEDAKTFIKDLNKALKNNLGNREKETLNTVTHVSNKDGILEFISDSNKDNPSYSFEIDLNQDYKIVG